MKLKRTLAIAIAGLTLGAAGAALAGNPNPTESQDPYWDLRDQAAAWQGTACRARRRTRASSRSRHRKPHRSRAGGQRWPGAEVKGRTQGGRMASSFPHSVRADNHPLRHARRRLRVTLRRGGCATRRNARALIIRSAMDWRSHASADRGRALVPDRDDANGASSNGRSKTRKRSPYRAPDARQH
jgi:hypothetical protein